jgi:hypothetical protein
VYDERRELISTLRATPVTLAALVGSLGDASAAVRRRPGWSASEVVCHLLDGEQRTYERVIRIRDEHRPELPLFPDDDYRDRSATRTLGAFTALRHEHIGLLESLEDVAWTRTGLHEVEGELSILDVVRHTVAHDADHLAQIATLQLDVSRSAG